MLPFALTYSAPLLTGPMPLVPGGLGEAVARGLLGAVVAVGRAAGREAGVVDRAGAELRVDVELRVVVEDCDAAG